MPELKKKQSDSTEKVEQQDSTKVEKKEREKPVKAGWTFRDNVGGIFTSKVAAIVRKLKGEE